MCKLNTGVNRFSVQVCYSHWSLCVCLGVCVHVRQGVWTAAFSAIMSVLSQDVCWTGQGWFYALLDILALWQMVNSQMCVFVCMYVATVVLIGTPILLISTLSSSSTDLLTDHTPWTSRTFLKCTKQNIWYIHGKPRSGVPDSLIVPDIPVCLGYCRYLSMRSLIKWCHCWTWWFCMCRLLDLRSSVGNSWQ